MKELDFKHGRLVFDEADLAMRPGLPDVVEFRVKLFYVDASGLVESAFTDFEQLVQLRAQKHFVWLHLAGSPGGEFWQHLHDFLELSDEQVKYLRSPHKAAFQEEFENGVFWSLLRAAVSENFDSLEVVNFFMSDKFLFTRQFSNDQMFTFVSHKLMEKGEHIADMCCGCLATTLIEDVINSYVDALKLGSTRLELLQNRIVRRPGKEELHLINRAQQMIWIFLNHVWPVENVLQAMARSTSHLWDDAGRQQITYRREEAASTVRLFETYRDMSYHLMDVYVSNLSLRTNRTTTILTTIATLILPPSLIAAIYGMNFFIPEVHAAFGYYFCLSAMVVISGGLMAWLVKSGYVEF